MKKKIAALVLIILIAGLCIFSVKLIKKIHQMS